MDNVLFENSCIYTEDVLCNWYEEYVKKDFVLGWILYGTIVMFKLIFTPFLDKSYVFLLFGAGLIAFLNLICLWAAKNQAKSVYQKKQELYNKPQEDCTTFFEDHVHSVNLLTNAELDLRYDQIKTICETKKLYILRYKRKVYVLLHKDGFSTGNKEDFMSFINSKKIKVSHFLTEWYN